MDLDIPDSWQMLVPDRMPDAPLGATQRERVEALQEIVVEEPRCYSVVLDPWQTIHGRCEALSLALEADLNWLIAGRARRTADRDIYKK
jgi:hypothetical protein